ncbi:hypothetical protein [Acidisphaera sp. S103]|uniref:hypothetical protein n=1 Tax=Acidisphaera sp. S103 TaxID=1747223 RepID=UPI00131B8A5F|nr:hypothetical protein [Acidisphaera sp. S103]
MAGHVLRRNDRSHAAGFAKHRWKNMPELVIDKAAKLASQGNPSVKRALLAIHFYDISCIQRLFIIFGEN